MKVDQTPFLSSTLNTQPYFLNRIWTLSSSSLTSAVSHSILITGLTDLRPSDAPLNRLKSLRSNFKSQPFPLASGVPQGSVFGSLLLIISLLPLRSIFQTHLYRLQCVFHLFVQLYASYFTPNCSLKKKAGCVFITLRCRGTSSVLKGACLNKVYFIPFSQQTLLTEWRYNREDVLCY